MLYIIKGIDVNNNIIVRIIIVAVRDIKRYDRVVSKNSRTDF